MIRAVLFDVDDTLCDDTGHFLGAAHGIGTRIASVHPHLPPEAVVETYRGVSDRYWTQEIALTAPEPLGIVRERLWRRAFSQLGIAPDPPLMAEVLAEYARLRLDELPALHEGALSMLEQLRAGGYRLGVVTNGLSETHVPKLQRLGLASRVDICLMPDVVGVAKPDPGIFHLACSQLGALPEQTVHVGDSLHSDVTGATRAGLHAVWFNPDRKEHPGGDIPRPCVTLHRLVELPKCLHQEFAPR